MNDQDKTKEQLLLELQELRREHSGLKASYELKLKESKEIEEQLQKRLHDLKKSQNTAKIGSWEFHFATNSFTGSEEISHLMGFPVGSEIAFQEISECILPEDREHADQGFVRLMETGETFVNVARMKKKDTGEIRDFLTISELILDPEGNPKSIIGVNQDITELKQIERELTIAKERAEESDRLKSAFLANMSHEIRTPMNGIIGFTELLKKEGLTNEQQKTYISIIEQSGERLLNIINDIMDISKIESGQMKVLIKKSDVNEQIDYIQTFFKSEVENKGIQLVIKNDLPSDHTVILTDREKLFAILTNLVKNAIKYTDQGIIEFGCIQKGDFLEFFVKDTGEGIPIARQAAIFERFIQADISDKSARHGTGLGLAITKAYVEMLGGTIWLESQEGKGSTFYFTLPYQTPSEEESTPQNESPFEDKDASFSKIKILIVENDEESALFMTEIVAPLSRQTLHTISGTAAIELCRNHPDIDLILMDIQIDDLNGYETTRQIRQFNNQVIIISQTAYALAGDREKALEAGCNDYIAKPINKNELQSLIRKYFTK